MGLQAFFYVYGALTIIGGVIGFVKGHSEASLLVGSLTGSVIILATWLRNTFPSMAFLVLLLVSGLLLAKFGPDFIHHGKVMPAGLMAGLSISSIILLIGKIVMPSNPSKVMPENPSASESNP
jgi:uncharacterized membrane protein (UPF0136 family)